MKYSVRKVDWETHKEDIRLIRTEVFIKEQQVPEKDEWDGLDSDCVHVLATSKSGRPIATGRLLETGQIGRMAVLKPARAQGVGSEMLQLLVQLATEMPLEQVFLKAQLHALRFYELHGFIIVGPIFRDAGLPHRKMIYNLT